MEQNEALPPRTTAAASDERQSQLAGCRSMSLRISGPFLSPKVAKYYVANQTRRDAERGGQSTTKRRRRLRQLAAATVGSASSFRIQSENGFQFLSLVVSLGTFLKATFPKEVEDSNV